MKDEDEVYNDGGFYECSKADRQSWGLSSTVSNLIPFSNPTFKMFVYLWDVGIFKAKRSMFNSGAIHFILHTIYMHTNCVFGEHFG